MKRTELWKNFRLGEELSVAGAFIYNGLRRFHEMKILNHTDEIFEVFYYLSIGIERLMKIAIVLIEHDDATDQAAFEKSLITHSHQELLARIKNNESIDFGSAGNEFLALLTTFYKSLRYDRFTLDTPMALGKEREQLLQFLEKHLKVTFDRDGTLFGDANDARYKKFIRKIVLKISGALFKIVGDRSRALNLYTYELRSGSKAETVFLGQANIPAEDVLWKELLLFFMNVKSENGYIKFLREIEPLNFDPALTGDYLDCFQSDSAKSEVMDELESLYDDVKDKKTRLEMMDVIGNPNVDFSEDDSGMGDDGENIDWLRDEDEGR